MAAVEIREKTTDEKTWLCPVCSIEKLKYGANCSLWEKGECSNPPNVNGQWYNAKHERDEKLDQSKTIGIGAISDEM